MANDPGTSATPMSMLATEPSWCPTVAGAVTGPPCPSATLTIVAMPAMNEAAEEAKRTRRLVGTALRSIGGRPSRLGDGPLSHRERGRCLSVDDHALESSEHEEYARIDSRLPHPYRKGPDPSRGGRVRRGGAMSPRVDRPDAWILVVEVRRADEHVVEAVPAPRLVLAVHQVTRVRALVGPVHLPLSHDQPL